MKLFLIAVTLVLAGCNTMPVKYSFPDAPAKLMVEPAPLKSIKTIEEDSKIDVKDETPSDVKMSQALKIITDNYKTSNLYLEQIHSLQEWIKKQKALNP